MSSFSSVIRKPGQRFAPKAAPRRNVVRNAVRERSPEPTLEVTTTAQNVIEPESGRPVETLPTAEVRQAEVRHEEAQLEEAQHEEAQREESQHEEVEDVDADDRSQTEHGQAESPREVDESLDQTAQAGSKRKRKSAPRAGANVVFSQADTRDTGPNKRRAVETNPDVETSQTTLTTSALEDDVTAQTPENGDEPNAPQLQSHTVAQRASSQPPAETEAGPEAEVTQRSKKKSTRKPRKQKIAPGQAAEVAASAVEGDGTSNGEQVDNSDDDDEDHEINETRVTMGELCKDRRRGKKSQIEEEMEANWQEILRRRKEDQENAREAALRRRKNASSGAKFDPQKDGADAAQNTVTQTIVNGRIVVAQESREIDRIANLQQVIDVTDAVREDRDIYKRVNSHTVGVKARTVPGARWDDVSTDLFYQGIRMFGTDFKMISNMIPGKTRKQVKLKYNAEERTNLSKLRSSLAEKQEVDLGQYSSMTGLDFASTEDVYRQMEEDERELREADEQRRREDGIIRHDDENVLPSVEQDGADVADAEVGGDVRTTADAGVGAAVAPKKRQQRKSTAASKRGRQPAGAAAMGGAEERLGTIDEVGALN